MTTTSEAANVLKTLKSHPLLTAKITFNGEGIRGTPQLLQVGIFEVLDPSVRVNTGLLQNCLGPGGSNSVDIGQRHFNPLVAGDVNAGDPCHEDSIERDMSLRCTEAVVVWPDSKVRPVLPVLGFSPGAACCGDVSC